MQKENANSLSKYKKINIQKTMLNNQNVHDKLFIIKFMFVVYFYPTGDFM